MFGNVIEKLAIAFVILMLGAFVGSRMNYEGHRPQIEHASKFNAQQKSHLEMCGEYNRKLFEQCKIEKHEKGDTMFITCKDYEVMTWATNKDFCIYLFKFRKDIQHVELSKDKPAVVENKPEKLEDLITQSELK